MHVKTALVWRAAAVLLLGMGLCACDVRPDGSNGQQRQFQAPGVGYEQAYRRADDYFQQCVRGIVGMAPNITTGNIYTDEHRAALQTINNSGIIVARVGITAAGTGSAVNVVTMKRAFLWNAKDLDAIQHAVLTGDRRCP